MISSFNPISQNPDNALLNGQLIAKQIIIKQKADQINQSENTEQKHQIPSQNIQKCATINKKQQCDQIQQQVQKEKLGQKEDKLSSLQQKNMRIFDSSMKIKINENKQVDSDLNKIYGKSEFLYLKQLRKQGYFLKVQELSQSMEICENADQIIMIKSLNEEDFKMNAQNPQIKDKSIKLIRSQSKRINLDAIQQPAEDSNLNYFINSELASSIMISPKKSKIVPLQNDHLSNQMNNNNNFSQKIDNFNISWNISSKQQQTKIQKNAIQNNSIAKTNAFGNSIIKQNNNNFNMSEYADEEEEQQQDIVMQSFNTQNHAEKKPKTINIQLKDLRFFQKSKNIIVIDLQNPTKLEQLKKSKNMQEWFMKRKSQELNQFQNYTIQNNKDINIEDFNKKSIQIIDEKQETEEMVCKICFEGENKDDSSKAKKSPLISPCLCQGSMKYIHQECLKEWIISKLCQEFNSYVQLQADLSKTQCEICKYTYRMEIHLGDRFLPSQAIKKGMKPLYLSLVTFLISCMLFYLAAHFASQSVQGDNDSMETGYSLGIGVCLAIVGCIFIFISIVCLRQCLYVKKIVTWIIFNSERQKKIDSIQTQINHKTFNGFRLNQIQTTQQENTDNQRQVLNQSQNFNQVDQSQINNTNNKFCQSLVMANNQSYQEQESQNLSPSRYSPSQINNIANIQRYQNAEDYNLSCC